MVFIVLISLVMSYLRIFYLFHMPPAKDKQAAAIAKAREARAEKKTALDSETALKDLWDELKTAKSQILDLELLLEQKTKECSALHSDLEKLNQKLAKFEADAALWREKHKDTYHELRMQHQTTKRGKDKINQLDDQVKILKQAETEASAQSLRGSQQSKQALV
jgi:DNA repair ATPase RecN